MEEMHISCDTPFSSPRAQSGGSQPLPGAAAPLAKHRPRAGGAGDQAQQWDRQHRGATEPGKGVPELGAGGTGIPGRGAEHPDGRLLPPAPTASYLQPNFRQSGWPQAVPSRAAAPSPLAAPLRPPPAGSPVPPPRGSGRGPRPQPEGSGGARGARPARGGGGCRRSSTAARGERAVHSSARRRGVPGAAGNHCWGGERREQQAGLGDPKGIGGEAGGMGMGQAGALQSVLGGSLGRMKHRSPRSRLWLPRSKRPLRVFSFLRGFCCWRAEGPHPGRRDGGERSRWSGTDPVAKAGQSFPGL